LSAAVVTLGLVLLVYLFLFRALWPAVPEPTLQEQLHQHLAAGRRFLGEDQLARAVEEFQAAVNLCGRYPQAIPEFRGRQLGHLARQVELLPDLLVEGLSPRLQEWSRLQEADVQRVFADYRGKAVIYDMDISRDPAGQYTYDRHLGPELPRLALHELPLLNRLPLAERQRVVFGARLAGLNRDPTRAPEDLKRWMVALEPESAVLITDADVATAAHLQVDASLRAVLERQAVWAEEIP
jgi:hypothetical protein